MFEKLIAKTAFTLERHGIPYMIIGGQAVLLYGSPRLTKDIDITMGVSVDKLSVIVKAINDINLKIIPKDFKEFVKKTFVLPAKDEATGIRIDFIFSFTPYERQAILRAKQVIVKDVAVNFASVEDVIIHKIFSGRPRDLEDIRSIIIKNPDSDKAYIENWLRRFDETIEGKRFIETFKGILRSLQ